MQESITAAARLDLAEIEMPHYAERVAAGPADRYAFPEEFPEGACGMAPDRSPEGHALQRGGRSIGREAEPFASTPYPYDRAVGPLTGPVADGAEEEAACEASAATPPAAGDEPSD